MAERGYVDLRSDTVTTPTPRMREVMADAAVGDDCYGEDPTVNGLQELAAEMLGMEAALFVPTGTMANQIALKVLSQPGSEVVCDADCHIIHHESGAAAILSQVQLRGLAGRFGVLHAEEVRSALRPADPFQPQTSVVGIENTHNAAGGTIWTLGEVEAVAQVAREHDIPLFCDGARLFNACVAGRVAPKAYAAFCDLVTISLYKGLAAPMGSLICGRRELIDEAWRYRRIFGGALRQAGIVAAAGIVALETMIDRLAEDHAHAKALAEGIAGSAPEGSVHVERTQTNIVVFDAGHSSIDAAAVLRGLRREGVLAGPIAPGVIRFVTHKDVDRVGIDHAIRAFANVMKEVRG